MMRSNNLSLTGDVVDRASVLAKAGELDSDQMILAMLQYQYILEDVHQTFRSVAKTGDSAALPFHAERMIANLDAWWVDLPEHLKVSGKCRPRPTLAKKPTDSIKGSSQTDSTLQVYASTKWAYFSTSTSKPQLERNYPGQLIPMQFCCAALNQ